MIQTNKVVIKIDLEKIKRQAEIAGSICEIVLLTYFLTYNSGVQTGINKGLQMSLK